MGGNWNIGAVFALWDNLRLYAWRLASDIFVRSFCFLCCKMLSDTLVMLHIHIYVLYLHCCKSGVITDMSSWQPFCAQPPRRLVEEEVQDTRRPISVRISLYAGCCKYNAPSVCYESDSHFTRVRVPRMDHLPMGYWREEVLKRLLF